MESQHEVADGRSLPLRDLRESSVTNTDTSVLAPTEEQHYTRILEFHDHGFSSTEQSFPATRDTPVLPAKQTLAASSPPPTMAPEQYSTACCFS